VDKTEIDRLKRAISRDRRGSTRPGVAFGRALRAQIVAHAKSRRRAGEKLLSIATSLGIKYDTVRYWLEGSGKKPRVRGFLVGTACESRRQMSDIWARHLQVVKIVRYPVRVALSERDVCTKYITPAIEAAGWDVQTQVREEITLTAGKVVVRGKLVARGKSKRADYVLYFKPNVPLAVIEAKDPSHGVGDGMQQALEYVEMPGSSFAFPIRGSGPRVDDRNCMPR
jgi:hypothetical protein